MMMGQGEVRYAVYRGLALTAPQGECQKNGAEIGGYAAMGSLSTWAAIRPRTISAVSSTLRSEKAA